MTVRVYNYAEVPSATLADAEADTNWIYHATGVEFLWLDCPISLAEVERYPACQRLLGPAALDLEILPAEMAARLNSEGNKLGFALPSAKPGAATAAWVFYERVEQLAGSRNAPRSLILGRVLAHEIGHLLLGPDHHSRGGIMRAAWNRKEVIHAAQEGFHFTPEEAKLIRGEVRARMRQVAASQSSPSGPAK